VASVGIVELSSTASQGILRNKIDCETMNPMAQGTDLVRDGADERKGIARELKRGALELIFLHLLRGGDAYGYEIVTALRTRTGGALEVADGTLYPVLYRLERAGYLEIRWETPARGVPRKYYTLTSAGGQELARLTQEWTTFAEAMARLLQPQSEAQ